MMNRDELISLNKSFGLEPEGHKSLKDLFQFCTSIDIESDQLNDAICQSCRQDLFTSYRFKTNALKAQQKLLNQRKMIEDGCIKTEFEIHETVKSFEEEVETVDFEPFRDDHC